MDRSRLVRKRRGDWVDQAYPRMAGLCLLHGVVLHRKRETTSSQVGLETGGGLQSHPRRALWLCVVPQDMRTYDAAKMLLRTTKLHGLGSNTRGLASILENITRLDLMLIAESEAISVFEEASTSLGSDIRSTAELQRWNFVSTDTHVSEKRKRDYT